MKMMTILFLRPRAAGGKVVKTGEYDIILAI